MADHGHHCPFLNRADARCSTHFQLNHLGAAFEHCLDHYRDCTVYAELLKERRQRRASAGSRSGFWARGSAGGYDADSAGAAASESTANALNPARATTAGNPGNATGPINPGDPAHPNGPPRPAPQAVRLPTVRLFLTHLTIANRHPQSAAGGSGVPPVPRF